MTPTENSKYKKSYPSDQNAVDIFKHEWSSKLPDSLKLITEGKADLFEDSRIIWAENNGINFKNKRVLELGPLEAGHTWMMDQRGTKEIVAIEANERAFLKCLIVKELIGIKTAKFLHGDFEIFLKSSQESFDICMASGVLYHSKHPLDLLNNICKCCEQLILWTHYFDQGTILEYSPDLLKRFKEISTVKFNEDFFNLHHFSYENESDNGGFCGGLEEGSVWLEKAGIEKVLSSNQFKISATGFDHKHHPNGPAIAMIAEKSI